MEQTPRANRIHIGIYGRCNSGKSSLINAITGQQTAVVSEVAGTTTDTVNKSMELPGVGAVTFIDTAGFDRLLTECGISRPVRLRGVVPGQIELRSVRLSPEETLFYAINYGPAVEFRPELEGVPVESARELISGKEVRFPVELKKRQPVMFKVKK